jgi:hypothetical protein
LVTAADDMTLNLKRKWFEAVVRQDMAYFDLQDVAGTSTIISTNGAKYKKGVAKKLGAGVQFTFTVLVRTSYIGTCVCVGLCPIMACYHILLHSSHTMLLISHRRSTTTLVVLCCNAGWFCTGLLQFVASEFGRLGMCSSYGISHGMDVEN